MEDVSTSSPQSCDSGETFQLLYVFSERVFNPQKKGGRLFLCQRQEIILKFLQHLSDALLLEADSSEIHESVGENLVHVLKHVGGS